MTPRTIVEEYIRQIDRHGSIFEPLHCEACVKVDANFCSLLATAAA